MDENEALTGWRSVVGAARLEPMATVSNPLWRVTGEDGRAWVLKRLPEYPPGVGPVEEFRVLCYLRAAGLPVAVPVITDDGKIAHNADSLRAGLVEKLPTGPEAYALIPWLPEDPGLSESPELAHTIGAGIGRLNRALADCPWQVTSFTDDPGPDILRHRFPGMPEELRELIAPFRDQLYAAIVDLPSQRTHGDCNLGNVLLHAGTVSGYIDVDHLSIGPRVRDLSYYLVSRVAAHLDHGDPGSLASMLPHYLAGFHETCPLTEREWQAVVPLMLTLAVGGADWQLNGRDPDPGAYREGLRTIGWLTERYDDLSQLLLTSWSSSADSAVLPHAK